jgi:hypothetical protein
LVSRALKDRLNSASSFLSWTKLTMKMSMPSWSALASMS